MGPALGRGGRKRQPEVALAVCTALCIWYVISKALGTKNGIGAGRPIGGHLCVCSGCFLLGFCLSVPPRDELSRPGTRASSVRERVSIHTHKCNVKRNRHILGDHTTHPRR